MTVDKEDTMAFCRNCGHEVHDTDNFCLYCGTATKDKTDNSSQSEQKRKESFDGEIKKCPYCGEILKSFETNTSSTGLYYLTGSQMFTRMQNVSESLAGRVGIIDMYGLSYSEIIGSK